MWIGAILMMLGLSLSFYIRPKRIWVLEKKDTILIGAKTKGDSESIRDFINKTIKNIQS